MDKYIYAIYAIYDICLLPAEVGSDLTLRRYLHRVESVAKCILQFSDHGGAG